MSDVAAALTQSVSKDGQTAMTGALNMGNNAITNVSSLSTNAITSASLTFSGSITANAFIPNSATVPTMGLYGITNTLSLSTATTLRYSINSTGNHVIAAPTAGVAQAISGFAGSAVQALTGSGTGTIKSLTDGTRTATMGTVAGGYEWRVTSNHSFALGANNTIFFTIASTGNISTVAPTSGVGLTVAGFAGTHSTKIQDSAGAALNAGYLEIPQNIQNAAYPIVLADAGKHIYHSDGTARTYTLPANASIAFPIGTTVTFVNDASAGVNVTIAITTDTLYWALDGTTGSRTLARYGIATALKVTATRWTISGTGLT